MAPGAQSAGVQNGSRREKKGEKRKTVSMVKGGRKKGGAVRGVPAD